MHFLLGASSIAAMPFMTENKPNLRRQWTLSQILADRFWNRWLKEYLPSLTRRTRWFKPTKPIEVGNLVIIVDGTMPRTCWLRGKVVNVYPGKDGNVRVADVNTLFGTYRRSVTKLCILDLTKDGEES